MMSRGVAACRRRTRALSTLSLLSSFPKLNTQNKNNTQQKNQKKVLFSRYCPLFDTGLTLGMRLLYTSVTWCYITNSFAVPTSVLVPFIALVFGIYPLVLNRDFALAATLYFSASTLVTSYCTNRKHMKPLWFCIVSCHLLWFTFTKAMLNVLFKKITKKRVVFKSTKKKGEDDGREGKKKRRFCAPPANVGDMEGTFDAWVLLISFCISFITALVGTFQMIDKPYTAQVCCWDFVFCVFCLPLCLPLSLSWLPSVTNQPTHKKNTKRATSAGT